MAPEMFSGSLQLHHLGVGNTHSRVVEPLDDFQHPLEHAKNAFSAGDGGKVGNLTVGVLRQLFLRPGERQTPQKVTDVFVVPWRTQRHTKL